ncbi:MAG: hypothetical protein ACT4OX_07220 [Actinomycetota bacterium]
MSVNLAVVRGTCSSPAAARELPSGAMLVTLHVTTRTDDAPATSVPVVCFDPPAGVYDLDVGDEIVALGRVRQRFFRTGAGTGSRVELEAALVARAGHRRRVQAVLRRAESALAALTE